MHGLDKEQLQQLQEALLDAFPSRADLAQMVRFGLDERLDAITSNGPLRTVTFELIEWATANGRVADLIAAARKANAGNAKLAGLTSGVAAPMGAGGSPKPSPAQATRRAVVVTALALEFRAVYEQLVDPGEVTDPSDGTVYNVGRLPSAGGDWDVSVVEAGAGNLNASLAASSAIGHFHPQAALFVGVAGGVKDVTLGDVVVATKVYSYESGKDTTEGFRPRPELGMAAHALLSRARAEAHRPDWIARIKGEAAPGDVKVLTGPIAAGEKVLADANSELVKFLRANYGDTLAVEMEGAGLMRAAHQRNVHALVVRGVSDLLDGKARSDEAGWQPRAARHAAAFAMQVLAKL